MSFFRKIFKSFSEKEIIKLQPKVDQILSLEEGYSKLTDEQLKNKTEKKKKKQQKKNK